MTPFEQLQKKKEFRRKSQKVIRIGEGEKYMAVWYPNRVAVLCFIMPIHLF